MLIRDVKVRDVFEGRNWRLVDAPVPEIPDWEVEDCADFGLEDNVVYSALRVLSTGEVRPLLVIREVGTYEWWGDLCEYGDGAWRDLQQGEPYGGESFVASPLPQDPSFMGEYSHDKQRAGFARWRGRLPLDG